MFHNAVCVVKGLHCASSVKHLFDMNILQAGIHFQCRYVEPVTHSYRSKYAFVFCCSVVLDTKVPEKLMPLSNLIVPSHTFFIPTRSRLEIQGRLMEGQSQGDFLNWRGYSAWKGMGLSGRPVSLMSTVQPVL